MIDWLFASLSGAQTHTVTPMIAWHARSMVLAWGVIVPVAVLIARYWKIWPGQSWPQVRDNKVWWHSHRYGQVLAVVLMTLGAFLAWRSSWRPSPALSAHATLGWLLVILGWMQLLGGWLRGTKGGPGEADLRGDHFDMTRRRRIFEWTHKCLGWLALVLACLTIVLGLFIVDAPRWIALGLLLWWSGLVILAWHWQNQGKCIDTYQAIWGGDPSLPGLKFAPIGFGIRRVNAPKRSVQKKTIPNTYPLEGDPL